MTTTFEQIAPALEKMTTREIGMWVHGLYPDDDPGMNRARCDVVVNLLGRELPADWWSLMTHGELRDADFPAWLSPRNLINVFRIGPKLVAANV